MMATLDELRSQLRKAQAPRLPHLHHVGKYSRTAKNFESTNFVNGGEWVHYFASLSLDVVGDAPHRPEISSFMTQFHNRKEKTSRAWSPHFVDDEICPLQELLENYVLMKDEARTAHAIAYALEFDWIDDSKILQAESGEYIAFTSEYEDHEITPWEIPPEGAGASYSQEPVCIQVAKEFWDQICLGYAKSVESFRTDVTESLEVRLAQVESRHRFRLDARKKMS